MTRVLTLCLVLGLPLRWAGAQELQAKYSTHAGAELMERYCSAFTSDGESLAVTAIGSDLRLEITPLAKSTFMLRLALSKASIGETLPRGPQSCGISISASNRRMAIGIPAIAERGSENRRGVLVILVDLETNQWGNQYFVESRQTTGGFPGLVGFLGDSESLLVVTDTCSCYPVNFTVEIIDASNGEVKRTTRGLGLYSPVRRVFFDTRNSFVWLELEPSSKSRQKSKSSTLRSISLASDEKPGPSVDFARLHHGSVIPKWVVPPAVAFPTPTTVVLAETGWSLGFGPSHLWIADLASGTLRVLNLPKDIGAALMHGLGLTWFEEVKGPAVLSPDGGFVVIPIDLTTTGPPYIVDNYVKKGSRLVIVDLQHLRILSSISPEHDREPVGFALDHRDGKVTLLVNWQEGWKRLQFDDSK